MSILTNQNSLTNITLVLDVDSTIFKTYCATFSNGLSQPNGLEGRKLQENPQLLSRISVFETTDPNTGDYTTVWTVKRPHLDLFIKRANKICRNIVIWTAGTHNYGESISSICFKGFGVNCYDYPSLLLTREKCMSFNCEPGTKPLMHIYNMLPGSNETNTVIVDDRKDTFKYNPTNAIHIPAYLYSSNVYSLNEILADDPALLQIGDWLDSAVPLINQGTDIRNIDKSGIFNRRPTYPTAI